jgi:hypothetical protein
MTIRADHPIVDVTALPVSFIGVGHNGGRQNQRNKAEKM